MSKPPSTSPPARAGAVSIPSGIVPFDERLGGLERGGVYLVVGAPGPAKMVAALQFLHAGVVAGDPALLVTSSDAEGILGVAGAWGFEMEDAWRDGRLQIIGFRSDFELRAIRSIEPDEVLEELAGLLEGEPTRIAVDPGTMFLTGGARTLLGAAFVSWANVHPATVLATFSVDGDAAQLPSSADWLIGSTTGRLVVAERSGGLYQITLEKAFPGAGLRNEAVSLALKPGAGLVLPDSFPARRGGDRAGIDHDRLLLVSLGSSHAVDIETWAARAFSTDVVSEPFEAVAKVQSDSAYGCVLVSAPRNRVREAVQACRALRPLTRAAIVFASDDAIRSTDRVQLLEAGADDCLSGGLDFRELDLRIRQAVAAGAKPVRPAAVPLGGEDQGPREGGLVTREIFHRELARRSEDSSLAFFCVVDVSSPVLAPSTLESALATFVRSEEGDLVSGGADRCLVLLQGAREGQLGPFLSRLHDRLKREAGHEIDPRIEVDVLSHPTDASRIRALLESAHGDPR